MRLTDEQIVKKELMIFAIEHDFFAYGSTIKQRSDRKYVAWVDAEKYVYTGEQLAADWDQLGYDEKKEIVDCYFEDKLI